MRKKNFLLWLLLAALPLGAAEMPPVPGDDPGLLGAPATAIPAITLNKTQLNLAVGETVRLTATVTGTAGIVTWSSSNPGFATVDQNGLITAVHEGSLTIAAQLATEFVLAECRVEIVAAKPAAIPAPAALEPAREITGIVIANELKTMFVGDELGIVAHCLPYRVLEDNPYTLASSNPAVLRADAANIAVAVDPGVATLSVSTPNGKTDSIDVEVLPAPVRAPPAAADTYRVEPERFGIVLGEVSPGQARANTLGVNHVLLYAQRWGYRQVVFPQGQYLLDPLEPIAMRSNLTVDLDGGTWQVMPNAYQRYALIRFQELDRPNLFPGFELNASEVRLPALAPIPLRTFSLADGRTVVRSRPIPVGELPDRAAPSQVPVVLARGATCRFSAPLGVRRGSSELEPDKTGRIEARLQLGYYMGVQEVAVQQLGKYWLRSLDAKLWCDSATAKQLRPAADYDNVRLEILFDLTDCSAEIFFDRPLVCQAVSAVLENSSLRNGTILGERDFKEALHPGWQRDGKTEGCLAISFDEGVNNGIEKLTVRKSPGFNIAARLGVNAHGAVRPGAIPVKHTNLEPGGLGPDGSPLAATDTQRSVDFVDIAALRTAYEFGNPLGYMGYDILRVRVYDIFFYDAEKRFLEAARGRLTFRKYTKPAAARFAKLVLHWDTPITAGLRDFQDAIGFITDFKVPFRNYIRDCVIEDNYSCGMAVCGGVNWRIEGNEFRRNGGRMPGSDIVWEDGWEYSQDDLVRNNTFESPHSIILCSGVNHVFRDNRILGKMLAYGRTQHLKIAGNTFAAGSHSLATQANIHICGNTFLGGSVKLSREHGPKGRYNAAWLDNSFRDSSLSATSAAGNSITGNRFTATAGNRPKVAAGAVGASFTGSFVLAGDKYADCDFANGVLEADPARRGAPVLIENSRLRGVTVGKPADGIIFRDCVTVNE